MIKPKILYVDDEAINLMLLEANLEESYHVITASSGTEGLNILSQNNDIKVVLSDMKMPSMNGIEFIKQAIRISPQVLCYLLTGYEITDEIKQALNSKLIRRYFKKPFEIKEILKEIESVL